MSRVAWSVVVMAMMAPAGGVAAQPTAPVPPRAPTPPPSAPTPAGPDGAVEAGVGVGLVILADGGGDSALGFPAVGLGFGGYLRPRTALTLRLAGGANIDRGAYAVEAFVGPSLQQFVGDHGWVGIGLGLGVAVLGHGRQYDGGAGLGVDLRAGYAFGAPRHHRASASVELTAGTVGSSVSLMLGYLMQ